MKCPECGGAIDFNPRNEIKFCPFCGSGLYDDESIKININKKVQNYDYAKFRKAEAYEKVELEKLKSKNKKENSKTLKQIFGFIIMIITIISTVIIFVATRIEEVVIFAVFGLLISFMLISD